MSFRFIVPKALEETIIKNISVSDAVYIRASVWENCWRRETQGNQILKPI